MSASTSSISEFKALSNLIKSSLDAYESALDAAQLPHPAISEAKLHPSDSPEYLPSHDLFKARQRLVGAAGLLKSAVQAPAERLMADSLSHHTSAALNVAVTVNVADLLQPAGAQGVPAEELSKKTGVHVLKLTKVLRYLANIQIFNEVSEGVFSNNRASLLLMSGSPIRDFVSWQTHFSLFASPNITKVLTDAKSAASLDPLLAASCVSYGIEQKGYDGIWSYLAKEMPERVKEFASAMNAFGSVGVPGMLTDYPWEESLPKGATIVDVGGGQGAMLLPILERFTSFKGVVQDRPEVIEVAKKNFAEHLPSALSEQRVTFESYDFFKQDQPHVGKHYVLRWILHDWPDDLCVGILKKVAAAMTRESKLIVIDTIVQPACLASAEAGKDATSAANTFPIPLSQGAAGQMTQAVDFEMMSALNATERTPAMFDVIFKAAGLRRTGLYNVRAPHGIVEAMLA